MDAPKRLQSRFMRKTLMPDEKVIRDARFPAFYTVSCYVTLAAFLLLGAALQWGMMKYVPAAPAVPEGTPPGPFQSAMGYLYHLPVAACVLAGLWQFFWMMMAKWTTEIVLTDQRLIYKRGFFSIDISEASIEQLASDHVVQSFLGRLFDYGQIHIRCIEATDFRLPAIAYPYEFRNAVEKQKHAYREQYMKVEHLRRHGDGAKA